MYNKKEWVSKEVITKEALNNIENGIADLDENKQDKTDNNLVTESKDIVGAINELFISANNGKQLIADAIGEPVSAEDTFSAMSDTINDLLSTFKTNMINNGFVVESSDKFKSLIEKLATSGINVNEIKQIACGHSHTFILKTDGTVYSCGNNGNGQLGLGDSANRYSFIQVTTNINNDVKQISCGYNHTFILKNDGSLWSCGSNNYGMLGLNDTDKADRNTFTQVTTNINNDVKQIVCGYYHNFIIKTDGTVWSCGSNNYGMLGLGDTKNRAAFTQVTTNINNDVKELVCGSYYNFIIKTDGTVWSCGRNNKCMLGLGDTTDRNVFTQVTTNINNDAKQIACGFYHTFMLKNDGSLWSCGDSDSAQLGLEVNEDVNTFTQVTTNINNDVKQISCGAYHTFILKNDGSLWVCGDNNNGQLGLGDNTNRPTFTQVTTDVHNDVKELACGYSHNFILKNDGNICVCGDNNNGQLGLGDNTDRKSLILKPKGL